MRLERFSKEIFYNYVSSMFVLYSTHEKLALSQISFYSPLLKKFKIIYLFLVLFFIFFCNQLPFFRNKQSVSSQLLGRKFRYLYLGLNLRGRVGNSLNILDNYLTCFGRKIFHSDYGKIRIFIGTSRRSFIFFPLLKLCSSFFFVQYNLFFLFKKFPELFYFSKFCEAHLILRIKQAPLNLSYNWNFYNLFFFIRFLKFPIVV